MDQVWQKRKRLIDTRLLVVFILKLVLSRNRQGDGISLNAMWETCVDKGITPPQTDAVAASFLCEARQKLPESVFKTLNDELIGLWHAHRQDMPNWKGHRVFAVDGSKLSMPRGLLTYGYKSPRDTNRYYPCRLMSCLYNLQEQLVYDFELVSHDVDAGKRLVAAFAKRFPDARIADSAQINDGVTSRSVQIAIGPTALRALLQQTRDGRELAGIPAGDGCQGSCTHPRVAGSTGRCNEIER